MYIYKYRYRLETTSPHRLPQNAHFVLFSCFKQYAAQPFNLFCFFLILRGWPARVLFLWLLTKPGTHMVKVSWQNSGCDLLQLDGKMFRTSPQIGDESPSVKDMHHRERQWSNPKCNLLMVENRLVDSWAQFSIPLHPGRLTWTIIMEVWKIIFLSKWVICRFHVNLWGGIYICLLSFFQKSQVFFASHFRQAVTVSKPTLNETVKSPHPPGPGGPVLCGRFGPSSGALQRGSLPKVTRLGLLVIKLLELPYI